MRNLNQLSVVFILSIFLSFETSAQERVLHGVVTTFDSIPVIGATVKMLSTKQIVLTDSLGQFSIAFKNQDKLRISAGGFYSQKVKISGQIKVAAINLKLKPGEKNREYAIGYGHVSDRDKLNAVASLTKNDIDFSQYSNMYEVIRGRFAGVQVQNGEIIIRGINSINSSNAALIVVDGIISDGSVLSTIPPVQVKSINVLKDGGAAIYGSRGANGVVLIDLKKGGD